METVFLFLAILPLLWEFLTILDVKRVHNAVTRFKITDRKEYTSLQKSFSTLMLGYIIWILVGLFTSQWIIFIALIILGTTPKKYILVRWIDSFITFGLLLFLVINAYHLHIDLFVYIKSLF